MRYTLSSRVLKNSDVRDESKFESEQGDSPRSWSGSPASGDQRCTDSKVTHPQMVVTAHRALLRSLEPAGLPAQHGSSRLGNARAEPQSRLIRVLQHPAMFDFVRILRKKAQLHSIG